jgi:tetratricopeptide (TPR) repeat protein
VFVVTKKSQKNHVHGQHTKSRTTLFYLIAVATPFLFFALIECGLRIAGYGNSYPLFIEAPEPKGYLLANTETIKRYFPSNEAEPIAQIEQKFFKTRKPNDGYRIFIQGESSAAGFPYGAQGALSTLLEQRLKMTFPGKPIEVISTAMSAVNSYTLLDFVDEIIEQRPDAVVIYTGHNEYVGVMGVGSTWSNEYSRPINLLMLKFKNVRIVQWLRNSYAKLTNEPDKKNTENTRGTLMSRAARGKEIPFQSDTYQKGLKQFSENLELILRKYKNAGIKVFISTLASNEKDLKPFRSGLQASTDKTKWQNSFQKTSQTLHSEPIEEAIKYAKELVLLDDSSADAYYLQAKTFLKAEQFDAARTSFLAAKDRDQLRFRAPEDMNQIIRELAKQYNSVLVDGQEKLRNSSPNHIIGNELILEHLHPNIEGYFLLSEAFYDAFLAQKLIGNWTDHYVDSSAARKEIQITDIDLRNAAFKVNSLLSYYPFTDTPKTLSLPSPKNKAEELGQMVIEKKISWIKAHELLLVDALEKGNAAESMKISLMLANIMPADNELNFGAATYLVQSKRYLESIFYLERVLESNPNNVNALLIISEMFMVKKDYYAAKAHLDRAFKLQPEQPQAAQNLMQMLKNMGY